MDRAAVEVTTERLDPAEAVVRASGSEIASGRLMGPCCKYASTVEIAYYFRPAGEAMRAIVPEPSFWEPQTPYLYEAILELPGASKIMRTHGLRDVRLGSTGIRVNGRPFTIKGAFRGELTDAAELRSAGINTIVCPVSPATAAIWDQADRFGFFVLGVVSRDADSLNTAQDLRRHASCLGWLFESTDVLDPFPLQSRPGQAPLLGLMTESPASQLPKWAQFAAGPSEPADGRIEWLRIADSPDAGAGPLGIVRH